MMKGETFVKTHGRDKGEKVKVVEVIDQNFVMIESKRKKRRCNIKHLGKE